MAGTKRYPVDKENLIHFMTPFTNELVFEVEYYDEDRQAWFKQKLRSVRYVYPLGGQGTVVLSSREPEE